MGLILLMIVMLLVLGGLPRWRYSRNWGYGPSSTLGVAFAVVLALMLLGHIPSGF